MHLRSLHSKVDKISNSIKTWKIEIWISYARYDRRYHENLYKARVFNWYVFKLVNSV